MDDAAHERSDDATPGATPHAAIPTRTRRFDVAVLGAGLAGAASALFLARRGRRVLLIDRDHGFASAAADTAFDAWARPGIPHFRQPHNFLGLAREVLSSEAPDVLEAMLALGAVENRQWELLPGERRAGDEALVSIFARRPVFELALRTAVEREAGIAFEAGTRATGLVMADRLANGLPRVAGVRLESGEEVHADLVVDALGRTSPVLQWLRAGGVDGVPERRSGCGILYYSRHFRLRTGVRLPDTRSLQRAPRGELGYMGFSIFVGDNRTFSLVLLVPSGDRDLRALRYEGPFMATALSMPALVPWVHPDHAEPITPVNPMGSLQNLHRAMVVDGRPVATGIQPIGDALCHTNPTVAFGASLSLWEAAALARIVDAEADPEAVARAFDASVGEDLATRFDAVTAEDRDRVRLWSGEPIDVTRPDDSLALFLRMTVYVAALKDEEVFRAVARRVNLLDRADALQRNEGVLARAVELARDAPPPAAAGPSRAEVLRRIAVQQV